MCCNLQTHTKVIAIICIAFAAIGSLFFIGLLTGIPPFTRMRLDSTTAPIVGSGLAFCAIYLASAIVCVIGSVKNNKCLLIPFMIEKSLRILIAIGGVTFSIYFGLSIWIISCFIEFGLCIYFLVIVTKYYIELSLGINSGYTEGMVYHRYNPTQTIKQEGGLSTAYVLPGTEHVPYA